jgi:hypothetical protein
VDLFDLPQRLAYLRRYLEVARQHPHKSLKQIAHDHLKITATAVQRIAALARRMAEQDIEDPYQPLAKPPDDYPRLRRHKNARYRFEPLQDFDDLRQRPDPGNTTLTRAVL